VVDGVPVAFGGAAHRVLHRPAQPVVQQRPYVREMVTHPGQPLDHHGDAVQGPQLTNEPVGRRAFQEGVLDPTELGIRQPWGGTGRPSAQPGVASTSLPTGVPLADVWRETPSWRAT
jgi:hypothetical protein